MSEEKYHELGEELANKAVATGLGYKQLRQLYQLTKTKPLPFVDAFAKRQTARAVQSRRGGPRGYDVFGPVFLDTLEGFKDDKPGLLRVLWYANMLFDYMALEDNVVEGDWREKLEPIVREACEMYGYRSMTLKEERGGMLCNVKLSRFRGNPGGLSADLTRRALNYFPELRGSIRFWIDYG